MIILGKPEHLCCTVIYIQDSEMTDLGSSGLVLDKLRELTDIVFILGPGATRYTSASKLSGVFPALGYLEASGNSSETESAVYALSYLKEVIGKHLGYFWLYAKNLEYLKEEDIKGIECSCQCQTSKSSWKLERADYAELSKIYTKPWAAKRWIYRFLNGLRAEDCSGMFITHRNTDLVMCLKPSMIEVVEKFMEGGYTETTPIDPLFYTSTFQGYRFGTFLSSLIEKLGLGRDMLLNMRLSGIKY